MMISCDKDLDAHSSDLAIEFVALYSRVTGGIAPRSDWNVVDHRLLSYYWLASSPRSGVSWTGQSEAKITDNSFNSSSSSTRL